MGPKEGKCFHAGGDLLLLGVNEGSAQTGGRKTRQAQMGGLGHQ